MVITIAADISGEYGVALQYYCMRCGLRSGGLYQLRLVIGYIRFSCTRRNWGRGNTVGRR